MKVLTVSGYAMAGKDLSAVILKEKFELTGKKVLVLHYADYLKFIARQYFNWDGNKDEKGRTLLQRLGTDKIRAIFPNFWVDTVVSLIKVFESDFDYFIIPDSRFENELTAMKDNFDTICIKIIRLNFDNGLTKTQKNHPSETALDGYTFDYEIVSETGKEKLAVELDKFVEHYKLL